MPKHHCDAGDFSRMVCPEPCGTMHSYCSTCGSLQDECPNVGWRDNAKAALPVIVAAVLKPIRELHASGEPVCVETGHTPSRCPCSEVFCESCDDPMPCPTVQLLDEIEADCKGGE